MSKPTMFILVKLKRGLEYPTRVCLYNCSNLVVKDVTAALQHLAPDLTF